MMVRVLMKPETKHDLIWFLIIITIALIGVALLFFFVSGADDSGLMERLYN